MFSREPALWLGAAKRAPGIGRGLWLIRFELPARDDQCGDGRDPFADHSREGEAVKISRRRQL